VASGYKINIAFFVIRLGGNECKKQRIYGCTECGANFSQNGRAQCAECQAWNTLVENRGGYQRSTAALARRLAAAATGAGQAGASAHAGGSLLPKRYRGGGVPKGFFSPPPPPPAASSELDRVLRWWPGGRFCRVDGRRTRASANHTILLQTLLALAQNHARL